MKRVLREVVGRCAVCGAVGRLRVLESISRRTLLRRSSATPFRTAQCLTCWVEYPIRRSDVGTAGASLRRASRQGRDWAYPAA